MPRRILATVDSKKISPRILIFSESTVANIASLVVICQWAGAPCNRDWCSSPAWTGKNKYPT